MPANRAGNLVCIQRVTVLGSIKRQSEIGTKTRTKHEGASDSPGKKKYSRRR